MADALIDPTRAPVAFGRWAVPRLFGELQQPGAAGRLRALASLCDLVHEPERLYQVVNGGETEELWEGYDEVHRKSCGNHPRRSFYSPSGGAILTAVFRI